MRIRKKRYNSYMQEIVIRKRQTNILARAKTVRVFDSQIEKLLEQRVCMRISHTDH